MTELSEEFKIEPTTSQYLNKSVNTSLEPSQEKVSDEFEPIYTNEQLKAINDFYKLKGKYEETLRRKKQKIINNPTLSKNDKRKAWVNEKIKCINCNKPVGTFFSVKNRRLIAHCGAVDNPTSGVQPCKLNIDIQLPSVTTIQETINNFSKYKEEDKEAIIKTKLQLLFGFLSESEAINQFESQRKEYGEDEETYNDYLELLVSIHYNKEKKDMIKSLVNKKESIIAEIKKLIKSTSLNEEIDSMLPIIRDAIIIQVNELDNVLDKIRELKYDYYSVEEDDNSNEYKLVMQPNSIQRSEITIDKEVKINHFDINK